MGRRWVGRCGASGERLGGGGGDNLSPLPTHQVTAPPVAAPVLLHPSQKIPTRIEPTKDIGFRIATAREITKEISRFRSIFPGSLALLERMGIASVDIVDLSGFSVEALMHIQEAY